MGRDNQAIKQSNQWNKKNQTILDSTERAFERLCHAWINYELQKAAALYGPRMNFFGLLHGDCEQRHLNREEWEDFKN